MNFLLWEIMFIKKLEIETIKTTTYAVCNKFTEKKICTRKKVLSNPEMFYFLMRFLITDHSVCRRTSFLISRILRFLRHLSCWIENDDYICGHPKVHTLGVESLGGHFACLCPGVWFLSSKKEYYYFSKRKGKYFYTFNHFYSEKSSKRVK